MDFSAIEEAAGASGRPRRFRSPLGQKTSARRRDRRAPLRRRYDPP